MGSDSKDSPPTYEEAREDLSKDIVEPERLLLAEKSVVSDTADGTPLYQMNWSVTSIPQKSTSVIFERIEHGVPDETKSTRSSTHCSHHIFYLAHPAGSQYQTDAPAYYITSASPDMPGNIHLGTSKSRFQKMEFKAHLSANKSASDNPLFDENPQPLFDIKPKWVGGHYVWSDSDGRQIAYEDRKGEQETLVITEPMERKMRDALVATWCLRLWHDTAESRRAKRDAMDRLTPAEAALNGYGGVQAAKRMGALGSLAGAGA